MDPARIQDVYTSELLQNIYEGLITIDEKLRVVPALAESWETSPDRKTYTFHLRKNARFHKPFDRPATAADVKYSLERALWPATKSAVAANYLAGIVGVDAVSRGERRDLEGVRVIDAATLTVTLDKPRGYFLQALTYPTGFVVCKDAIEKNDGILDEKAAIGTGPFSLERYQHGYKVTLAANPEYWGGKPLLARIDRSITLDTQTQHVMYENGEMDAVPQVALSDFVSDQNNPSLRAQSHLLGQANVFYLVMHPGLQPVFKDRKVRRAIAEAIDRDEVARIAYKGTSPRADGLLPPGILGHDPNIPKIPYDPVAARRLLSEAGFPGGQQFPPLTLVFLEKEPQWSAMAHVIRDYLMKNLGITIALQEHEAATFWADTSDAEKIPFFITGWVADYPDPQDFLSTLLRTGAKLNHVAYGNPEFDRLCDQADAESDSNKRAELYRQVDRIAMRDVAVLPLVFYNQPMLVKPQVKDYRSNLMLFFLPHTRTRIEK